ncbi:MAG: hypothetical protein COT89_01755 [Candidatus Colwellbacteria bacterium CG10_big_fil_rev_8_21_14_0_10_42_22]|uniref:PrgI family protein n=1 Tax=Candidatus Colwellbacteria bacterium CG10_big_fil_rev_8_21_14_0_10_42_22 TaxID=1974540 RepID=A0A2H0VHX5_9BACT|nr:MAG: hypothetical protein COT89_01755 [Candidatus Colwellbacteria bacterium CG10_big_fil_rev_8_21_14_0_10_42_22]
MIQFQVPQFIETEDRIVGPLTLRQFVYVGAAGAISGILLFFLELGLWLFITAILGGIAGFLAFGKFNGRPITYFLVSLFQSIWSPSIYVFKPKQKNAPTLPEPKVQSVKKSRSIKKPDFGGVKNLWTQMNTSKNAIPHREKPLPSKKEPFGEVEDERYQAVRSITGEREVAKRIDYR